MKFIDNLLNKVTMYRLVVYELVFLLCAAALLGYAGVLAYTPLSLLYSTVFIFGVSWVVNKLFAAAFDAPSNPESTWITALILALIITPPTALLDPQYLPLAFWAAAAAIASKYIVAINRKHIFNPAAFGVAATSLVLGLSASWWVGTLAMLPFVLLGGMLVVRKIRRFDLWWAFMAMFTVGIIYFTFDHGLNLVRSFSQSFLYAPAIFFATVMLTEPLTGPATRLWRILYAAGIAFLFLPNVSIGSFYFTPELALLMGNLGAYIVSPKQKPVLTLRQAVRLSPDVYEFSFTSDSKLSYKAGQYMEWTLGHARPDSRGVRRYFTLSSSPTESEVKLGVKFYKPASTFKKALLAMRPGDHLTAGHLAGDFTLPRNSKKKLVFIAGGIGVTPFRSMVQYLLDKRERRAITLLYATKTPADAVYGEIFGRAERELGMKTVPVYTPLSARLIAAEVPDYRERYFYLSGPQGMVTAYKELLLSMGVHRSHIHTDYFPGFA